MRKIILFLVIVNLISFSSCSEDSLGPGYRWDLFKDTPNWDLAKAVAEEDTTKIFEIIKSRKININLQEPKFGRTVLMLAVGNDKEKSTEALLKMGADVDIRDYSDDQAIHEAVAFIGLRKHSLNILKFLLNYHAEVNSISLKGQHFVPLQGATDNLACAKLLLNNGANAYYKTSSRTYPVWLSALVLDNGDNIFVAKYMIIDKKMPIPSPIAFAGKTPLSIYDLLEKEIFHGKDTTKKQQAKDEIINYLKRINFPINGVYKEVDSTGRK